MNNPQIDDVCVAIEKKLGCLLVNADKEVSKINLTTDKQSC